MNTLRAPTDCVQYFTGRAGSVKSYNYAGGQLLTKQRYNNCIRTEKGYCAIQWKESSTTSPDPFGVGADAIAAIGADGATACPSAHININDLSPDGINRIPACSGCPATAAAAGISTLLAFQHTMCGINFGIEGTPSATNTASLLVCKFPKSRLCTLKLNKIFHLKHGRNHFCWDSTPPPLLQ